MTYMPTITCFQFQLCTHVDYQLCKQQNEKKKNNKQTNHFQGAQKADHHNKSSACSQEQFLREVRARWNTRLAVHTVLQQIQHSGNFLWRWAGCTDTGQYFCPLPAIPTSLPSPVNVREEPGALKNIRPTTCAQDSHSTTLCPQKPEHMICKVCQKTEKMEGSLLIFISCRSKWVTQV